jgi:hypothetical protein
MQEFSIYIPKRNWLSEVYNIAVFLKRDFVTQKVCTARIGTSYKVVPLTNFYTYLHYDTSETEVSINISAHNGSEKLWKKKRNATSGKVIPAV